jgi:hypothetical protein
LQGLGDAGDVVALLFGDRERLDGGEVVLGDLTQRQRRASTSLTDRRTSVGAMTKSLNRR